MSLHKIWLIAKREFWFNLRRRAFLASMFLFPIFFVGLFVLGGALGASSATDISSYTAVGIVDESGIVVRADGTPYLAEMPEPFRLYESVAAAQRAFEAGTLDGYYVLREDFLTSLKPEAYYRREKIFGEALTRHMMREVLKPSAAAQVGDADLVARLESPLGEMAIYRIGSQTELPREALFAAIFAPILVGTLMFVMTMNTSQFLMLGLADEKENRMMEMFMTSARPIEMLWGKLIGLGALGLLQIAVWLVMGIGFAATQGTDILGTLATFQLDPSFLLVVAIYAMLGYAVFGAIMAAIGASVNTDQEARQVASLISLVAVLPMLFLVAYFIDPNGGAALVLSLVPFTSPVGMPLRMAVTNVPAEHIWLGIGLHLITIAVVMWLAARVFRLGMLNYGKRLSLRDLWRALREGRQQIISARSTEEAA
ncbi:MAG: ABC transporter permease [Chloroflexi bacterium CFX4]|nr:ABC transporter permease [Chloroflexi bacterium CFX4]MDL1923396.1 ABC transporter permease [Chloroflexi bacterium CFX3]